MEMTEIQRLSLSGELRRDVKTLSDIFSGDDIFTVRHFHTGSERNARSCAMLFFDGMIYLITVCNTDSGIVF